MPSRARAAFDANAQDIVRLVEIHKTLGGTAAGRRHQLEVLNKSALVLLVSVWEAYCEDIASEALEHIVEHATFTDALPEKLRRQIAKELREDKNELAVWSLAGEAWRPLLRRRLQDLRQQRNRNFNSPKWALVDELFRNTLGVENVSESWHWRGMSVAQARKKLNRLVELRGEIAHRGGGTQSYRQGTVDSLFRHIKRLVGKTGQKVAFAARAATGKKLW